MKKTICLALMGSWSLAAAPCTTAPLSTYTVTGFNCTLDLFTFKDFLFAVPASIGVTPISASAINILPTVTNGSLGLTFSSQGFSVGAGQSVTYEFRYNVDPPPDIIIESDDQLNSNTPVFPGSADLVTNLCVGSQWIRTPSFCDPPGTTRTLHVFHNGTPTGNRLFDSTTFPAVNRIGYDNFLKLDGGRNGSSSITGFENVTVTASVPEPASLGLFLAGAALLASRRLRAKAG